MSARAIQTISGTFDPVSGVIVVSLKLRPEAASHASLYKLVSDDLAAADPTPTFTKTLGTTNGTRNGDIDLVITMPTL